MSTQPQEVLFRTLDEGTAEDFAIVQRVMDEHAAATLVDNVLSLLPRISAPPELPYIGGYQHSLQSATRAERDGARIDLVVAALLHDIGEVIAPSNHSELAAAVLQPYLDEEAVWVVRHHGIFQGYHYWHKLGLNRDTRDAYRESPYFDTAAYFCEAWDQRALDPDYDTLPLEHFEPMVREVFARPAGRWHVDSQKATANG